MVRIDKSWYLRVLSFSKVFVFILLAAALIVFASIRNTQGFVYPFLKSLASCLLSDRLISCIILFSASSYFSLYTGSLVSCLLVLCRSMSSVGGSDQT